MVEGARLERVYTGNRIEGSNPSLSASIIPLFQAIIFGSPRGEPCMILASSFTATHKQPALQMNLGRFSAGIIVAKMRERDVD